MSIVRPGLKPSSLFLLVEFFLLFPFSQREKDFIQNNKTFGIFLFVPLPLGEGEL